MMMTVMVMMMLMMIVTNQTSSADNAPNVIRASRCGPITGYPNSLVRGSVTQSESAPAGGTHDLAVCLAREARRCSCFRSPKPGQSAERILYTLGDGHFVACRSVVKLYSQVGVSKHMHGPDVCSSFMWRTPSLVTTTQCSECCIWQIMHMNSE